MRILDLFRMSSSNLLRRKLRTFLTVLGVVIGTASIVVMISLGLGLRKSTLDQIEQYGGLTTINVYSNDYYGSSSSDDETKRLSDEVVEEIAQIPHVELVSPKLSIYVMAKQGVYEGNFQIYGMTAEALRRMDIKIGQGELPPADGGLQLFYGNQILTNFYNAKKGEYYWETGVLPDVDLMNDPVFIIFDTDAYWQSKNNDGSGQTTLPPKKYIIPTSGLMEGSLEDYSENAYSVSAAAPESPYF